MSGPVLTAERQAARKGGPAELHAYLERYQVDVIVLNIGAGQVVPELAAHGWALVHLDDSYFIMVRQKLAQGMPIYKFIRSWENAPVDRGNATQRPGGGGAGAPELPAEAAFAWSYKARALRTLGRHQEALDAAVKIPKRFVVR